MKWIPVTERLPELTEPLMGYNDDNIREVFIENHETTVLGYNHEIGVFKARLTKNGWSEISSISVRSTITPTHWMPLPPTPDASLPSSSVTGEEDKTAFVPCDEHDERAAGFFHSLDGKLLGYVREITLPKPGESEAIAVLDWLLEFESTEGGFPDKIIICDGDYYWESDNDGDQPLDGKDIMKIYKQSSPNSEAIGERKFTLKEVFEVFQAGYNLGEQNTKFNLSLSFDNVTAKGPKQYFKDKFGIDI